jgi:hypothetical protein
VARSDHSRCREELGALVTVGELLYVRDYIGRHHEFAAVDRDTHQIELMSACCVLENYEPNARKFDRRRVGRCCLALSRRSRRGRPVSGGVEARVTGRHSRLSRRCELRTRRNAEPPWRLASGVFPVKFSERPDRGERLVVRRHSCECERLGPHRGANRRAGVVTPLNACAPTRRWRRSRP